MAKIKATEEALGKLHEAVAKGLTEIIEQREAVTEFDADGTEVATGETRLSAPPAYFAAAIKLLKDNTITCDIKVDKNMSRLSDTLNKQQKRSRLTDPKIAVLKVAGDGD